MTGNDGKSVVGVVGTSRDENHAFIYLSGHFAKRQLPVPQVLAASNDELRYLQTDLGALSLYEAMRETQGDPIWRGTQAVSFLSLIDRFAKSYEGQPISDVLTHLLDESGYEAMLRTEGSQERLDNLAELKQSVRDYETTCGEEAGLMDYLAHIALFSNRDAGAPGDRIRLMTVHTAKGLEFPIVFLCAMSEGIFPSRKTRTKEGIEEERRLAFVAMTRAEQRLYLSDAEGLNFDGSVRFPSRFLFDIGKDQLEIPTPLPESLVRDAKAAAAAKDRRMARSEAPAKFAIGDRVAHRIFGAGTVKAIDEEKRAYVIAFDDLDTMRSIAFQAKLEKA
jgi:DNA helicase-2/ATP-dependent DNA helicase PcrA